MITRERLGNIFIRGGKYFTAGIGTYLLDLCIVLFLTTYMSINLNLALIIGFLIGTSVGFFISFHWTFKGTAQTLLHGYLIFIALALCGSLIISFATTFFITYFAVPLLIARTLTAFCLGVVNFFINGIFNFRIL